MAPVFKKMYIDNLYDIVNKHDNTYHRMHMHMHIMDHRGPKHYIFVTSSTRKMPECSDSMNPSIFMPENIWYHHFTRSGLNSQEILNFILI